MKTTPTHSSEEKAIPISRTGSGWISISNLACLLAIAAVPAHAQTNSQTWDGGGGDNNWSTAANWTNDTVPINQFVDFAGTTQTSTNNDITAGKYIYQLRFKNTTSGQNFTVGGNQVFVHNAVKTSDVASGNITDVINLNIDTLDGNWIIGTNHDLIMNGTAGSGSDPLIKSGGGTLTLAGANTYTGATTVTAGTLEIGGAGSLGSGSYAGTIANSGAFEYNSSANQTLSGVISGTGSVVKGNSGTLTLGSTVANTYSGGTTINDGIISLGTGGGVTSHQDALGTGAVTANSGGELRLWISNGGSFTIDNAFTLDGGTVHGEDGIYDLSGAMTLAAGGGTLSGKWSGKAITVSGTISGTGALTIDEKAGGNGGEVILTANNNFSGGTTVDGGTLKLTGSGRIGNGGLTVNNGGTLSVATNAYNSLGGAITVNEGGTLSTDSTGNNQNAHNIGAITLNGGTLTSSGNTFFQGNWIFNGDVTVGGSALSTISGLAVGSQGGGGTFNVADSVNGASTDLLVSADITLGSLTKTGAGTMELTGANTYTGATFINEGTLAITNATALGSTVGETTINTNAKLNISGGITTAENITNVGGGGGKITGGTGGGTFTGLITLTNGIDLRGDDLTFSGGITSTDQGFVINGARYVIDTTAIDLDSDNSGGAGTFGLTSAGNSKANATELNVGGNDWGLARINFGGYLKLGGDNYMPADAGVEFGWNSDGASSGTLDLNGFDQTVAFLRQTTIFPTFNGDQNITGGGTLTIDTAAGTYDYHGRITDGATATSLVKAGTGTQILANNTGTASNYSGTTTINAGTLALVDASGTNNIASSSAIDVASGATLDVSGITNGFELANGQTLSGSGTVSGGMTVSLGSIISPGNSPGTMTVDDLTWTNGGTYLWEINADFASGGGEGVDSGWDLINVTSDWDISGITSGFNIDITSLTTGNIAGLADGFDSSGKAYLDSFESFTILSFGSLTGTFDASEFNLLTGNFANSKVDWNIDIVGNDLVLNAVFVPEPSSAALLGLGLSSLLLRRKRS